LINGAANNMGKIETPFSIRNKSALMSDISLPELVMVMLFIDSFTTLSKRAAIKAFLKVLLTFRVV
jgi:hypothetical protein